MRFEAKHNYFKDLVKSYLNFKSIAKTLGDQHQRYIYTEWRLKKKTFDVELSYSKVYSVQLFTLMAKYKISDKSLDNVKVSATNKIECNYPYEEGLFIITGNKNNNPVFSQIRELFIINDCPYAICPEWCTNSFIKPFHAYNLSKSLVEKFHMINLKDLEHPPSYEIHQSYDSTEYYIVVRYSC